MASLPPGVFLFLIGFLPITLGKGLYLECILSTPVTGTFAPCEGNHTVTFYQNSKEDFLTQGELTTQCDRGDKSSNKNKNILTFEDGVSCCFHLKNCLLYYFAEKTMNINKKIMMVCTAPSTCNIEERLRLKKKESCTMDKCTFRKAHSFSPHGF
ncbi:hypothetical protein XENTR_v10023501 [Xenopus tropicalis]|nr:hypothetical protein XENTR_v10023501 [Xenopus tropicalis]KAE8578384.1 hypothetical protein XENTR_v10023501 [Xenopus tropicalis]KAE8578385.1 hypothetical protein XENTR_v10023501 [Xenopus tropicalis]